MGVVTLSAAYGSGGPEIGPAVAERLGLPFHDRVIPVKVAGRLGVPVEEAEANDETVVGGLWRMVASLGAMPDTVGGVVPGPAIPDSRAFREQTERVLTEIASPSGGGGVVLGRAAAIVLGDRADVLHVRLGGSRERRLESAVARYGRPAEEIRREMDANDRAREAYVRHFYRADASSPRHYHLVIDSTAIPHATVVDLVVAAARARGIGH
jgi:hypothetical protein